MELNIDGLSKRGKPKLKVFLASVDTDCYIGSICIIDEAYQADFDLTIQDMDSLIGFLEGMKKHITENN